VTVSTDSITSSLSFRLVRLGVGIAWFLQILGTLIVALYLTIFIVTGGKLAPSYNGGGFNVGSERSFFRLDTTQDLPIRVAYVYDGDAALHTTRLPMPTDQGEGRVMLDGYESVRLRLQDGFGAALSAIGGIVALAVWMFVTSLLRDFCRSVGEGEAFSARNVSRLRRIGIAVLVVPGLLILVVAQLIGLAADVEADRERLQADQELTV
jgi:hypothetical protein